MALWNEIPERPSFALRPQDESLVGDLVEEYGSGRSRAWYWRQVLSGILLDSVRQIGAHPARALVAVAIGWAAFAADLLPPRRQDDRRVG